MKKTLKKTLKKNTNTVCEVLHLKKKKSALRKACDLLKSFTELK